MGAFLGKGDVYSDLLACQSLRGLFYFYNARGPVMTSLQGICGYEHTVETFSSCSGAAGAKEDTSFKV